MLIIGVQGVRHSLAGETFRTRVGGKSTRVRGNHVETVLVRAGWMVVGRKGKRRRNEGQSRVRIEMKKEERPNLVLVHGEKNEQSKKIVIKVKAVSDRYKQFGKVTIRIRHWVVVSRTYAK